MQGHPGLQRQLAARRLDVVADAILRHTAALCPLVAVQPIYMHPYTVAKADRVDRGAFASAAST